MKRLYIIASLALAVTNVHIVRAEMVIVQQDTIDRDTIRITPNFGKTPTSLLTNFAVVKKDRQAFQTYAGFNVLNSLRGHVPNLNISPNPYGVTAGMRGGSTLLVIDGLTYDGTIDNYYNLNSFDYENIYAVSSGNGTIQYGGSNGAVFMQSKTGANLVKPVLEFNSTPTLMWQHLSPSPDSTQRWALTNAIAYASDLGAVDTRVSYTATALPDGQSPGFSRAVHHYLRINTGADITKNFNARLILDGVYQENSSGQVWFALGGSYRTNTESDGSQRNIQGNLMLRYQVTDWLTITSQSFKAKIGKQNLGERSSSSGSSWEKSDDDTGRSFVNLFVTAKRQFFRHLWLTTFAGVQSERKEENKNRRMGTDTYPLTGYAYSKSKYENKNLIAGLSVQVNSYLLAEVTMKSDRLSLLRENPDPGYSAGTSFLFSEAFALSNKTFSAGKFRLSFGKNAWLDGYTYPAIGRATGGVAAAVGVSPLVDKKIFETGTDLSFLQHRLDFNVTYFQEQKDQFLRVVRIVSGASGSTEMLVNLGESRTRGWEIVLSGKVADRRDFSWTTGLMLSTLNEKVRTSYPTAPSLGNPSPDWTGSVLSQISFKNFFSTFLVDVRKGGDLVFYSSGNGYTTQDATNVKMRDFSIGYTMPLKPTATTIIREAKISLSARNPWTIHSNLDKNHESQLHSTILEKSMSLSLSFVF